LAATATRPSCSSRTCGTGCRPTNLAWFIRDVVDQLDLGPFLAAYRADGHGRAADEPGMLLAVLLYGYCTGIGSSRQIERRCTEDIAFRVLSGNSALIM
jgi:transposase